MYLQISTALTIMMLAISYPTYSWAVTTSSRASTSYEKPLESSFPVNGHVAKQVWFWESVFSKYGSHQVLIHDANHPEIVLDIIDFNTLKIKGRSTQKFTRRERDYIVQKYIDRYQLAIQRFSEVGERAIKHGAMENRVFSVYTKSSYSKDYLMRGRVTLRGQVGLVDEFARAAERSEPHLSYMEEIFRGANLPIDLTRLTFVESMFNGNAISKVGASGIWQFMPETARSYMYVNHYIDERNSPYKATKAAAQLLSQNFRELKSWPLAITAYNHGRGGIARGAKVAGTSDLSSIILRYRAPSFGFASKNFYAEFIAARNTYNRYHAKFRSKSEALSMQAVPIRRSMTVAQLIQATPMDPTLLKSYNPCLLPRAFGIYKSQLLPSDYEIIVPKHLANKVRTAIDRVAVRNTNTRKTW